MDTDGASRATDEDAAPSPSGNDPSSMTPKPAPSPEIEAEANTALPPPTLDADVPRIHNGRTTPDSTGDVLMDTDGASRAADEDAAPSPSGIDPSPIRQPSLMLVAMVMSMRVAPNLQP
ncbi:hypothetical protein ONZ45_g18387 [Pleurotus djamor]|nr:hypothetical protein ONZ45_g18387 [Pleurotus djamor]